ncbi:MAG: PHB depolymerase family esterase [Burkholderiaceae bacterium]|nr:PHB depolymerase family esterase [Burkholderiaceae bacterium]
MKRRRTRKSAWAKAFERSFAAITRSAMKSGTRALGQVLKPAMARRTPPPGAGTRHPGRFKAVVMHSGIPPGTAHSTLSALGAMHGRRPTMPLAATPSTMEADWPPLLVIHGDADAVLSPHNGQAAAQVWARAAGARASAARSVQRGKRYPMSVTDFKRKGSTVATLVAVDGLAHAWSGGAASKPFSDGQGPDASRMAWAFAAKQFRSEA